MRWPGVGGVVLIGLFVASGAAFAGDAPREVDPERLPLPDAEVFMKVDATDRQIARIRTLIEGSKRIEEFAFLTQQDAHEEYERLSRQGASLPPLGADDELPVSFRVIFRRAGDDEKFTHNVEDRPGVDGIQSATTRARQARIEACNDPLDLEVYMKVRATDEQVELVRRSLGAHPAITEVRYISRREAIRLFRCFFKGEEKYDWMPRSALPVSFKVAVVAGADLEALVDELELLGGVDAVVIESPRSAPTPA